MDKPMTTGDDTLCEQLARALAGHVAEWAYASGCPQPCGHDGTDRDLHLAGILLPLIREFMQAERERVPERLFVVGEYAAAEVGACTCGAGDPETGHEPHCGLEPFAKIDTTEHDAELIRRVVQAEGVCCDSHNRNCEPPSELCCWECTEVNHPRHPPGKTCVIAGEQLPLIREHVERAVEQARADERRRLASDRLLIAVFGLPDEAPQPFVLVNDDPKPKPFAYGVQWPGGTVTVKAIAGSPMGNITSPSLEDHFTQYGKSAVIWLSEDLGTLADAQDAILRVRALADNWLRLSGEAMDQDVREWTSAAGRSVLTALDGTEATRG